MDITYYQSRTFFMHHKRRFNTKLTEILLRLRHTPDSGLINILSYSLFRLPGAKVEYRLGLDSPTTLARVGQPALVMSQAGMDGDIFRQFEKFYFL